MRQQQRRGARALVRSLCACLLGVSRQTPKTIGTADSCKQAVKLPYKEACRGIFGQSARAPGLRYPQGIVQGLLHHGLQASLARIAQACVTTVVSYAIMLS